MATIKIIRTDDEFRALKPEWDKIFAQNPDARVFQSFRQYVKGLLGRA